MVETRAIIADMHRPTRAIVLSIITLLLIMASPSPRAHARQGESSRGSGVDLAGQPPSPADSAGYIYTVRPADTLWDIASAHGISVSALIAANDLADPQLLRPGQSLFVPAPPPRTLETNVRAVPAARDTIAPSDGAGAAANATTRNTPLDADAEALGLPPEKAGWPSELLTLINRSRAAAGLPPLVWSPELARAAQAHALDCAQRNQGGHLGSDGSPLRTRIAREGLSVRWASENWADAQSTQHAFDLWWHEAPGRDPHRRNILNPKYTEIGIGVADARWSTIFVADFAGR